MSLFCFIYVISFFCGYQLLVIAFCKLCLVLSLISHSYTLKCMCVCVCVCVCVCLFVCLVFWLSLFVSINQVIKQTNFYNAKQRRVYFHGPCCPIQTNKIQMYKNTQFSDVSEWNIIQPSVFFSALKPRLSFIVTHWLPPLQLTLRPIRFTSSRLSALTCQVNDAPASVTYDLPIRPTRVQDWESPIRIIPVPPLTSEIMVTVWRLRENIIMTVIYDNILS